MALWLQPLDVICSCHARADLDEDDNDDTAAADCLPVQLDPGCGGIREHERRQLHGVPPPFVLTDVSYFAHSNLLSSLDDVLPSIEIFGSTYSLIAGTYHRFGHFTAAIKLSHPIVSQPGWYSYDGLSASMKWISKDVPHTPVYHHLSYLIYAMD